MGGGYQVQEVQEGSSMSRRASVDVLFIIMLVFFIMVALPRDLDSPLGQVGLAIDSFLEMLTGGGISKCPLLRKGAMISSFSDIIYPITAYYGSSYSCSGSSVNHVIIAANSEITIPNTESPTCSLDEFINFEANVNLGESMLKCDSSVGCNNNRATATCGEVTYNKICLTCENGRCQCPNPITNEPESCDLDRFIKNFLLDEEAVKERDVLQFMSMDMPGWVCIFFFGIMPFMIAYYFVDDIMKYTALRPSTRKAISVSVGMIGVVTGALVGVTLSVVRFAKLTTSFSTLFILLGIGFFSAFLMVMASFGSSVASAGEAHTRLHYTISVLERLGKTMSQTPKK